MAKKSFLGIYKEATDVADATEALERLGVPNTDFDVLTGSPYPEGAFGEQKPKHRVYVFPFIGAALGLSIAIILTIGTQAAYPLVTGGKPILSIPPMAIISYEGTMLGAILFTVLGIIFESRLPRLKLGLYDPRITEGYIGLLVSCDEGKAEQVQGVLKGAGAEDIKSEG